MRAGSGSALEVSVAVGEAVRRAAGADFALVGTGGAASPYAVQAGVARVCDVVPFYTNLPVGMFEVTGAELLRIARSVAAKDSHLLIPGFDPALVLPAASYRVALPVNVLWAFSGAVQPAPARYWMTGVDAGDAVEHFLPRL